MIKLHLGVMLLALLHRQIEAAEITPLTLTSTGNNDNVCPPPASLEQARVNISTVVRGLVKNFIH